jgi:translation initiation factor 5A
MSDGEEPHQEEDFTIDTTDAGASTTFPMQAGLIRKGGHIVINGRPCKVADISTSKTGKHGHAKANIVGIDIFTDRKYEDICPTSHNVDVPHVTKREYPVLDISDDGFCSLMCDDGSTKVFQNHFVPRLFLHILLVHFVCFGLLFFFTALRVFFLALCSPILTCVLKCHQIFSGRPQMPPERARRKDSRGVCSPLSSPPTSFFEGSL